MRTLRLASAFISMAPSGRTTLPTDAMVLSTPKPGTMIAGKYRVVCSLGEGGMGVVILAIHEPLGAKVALKILAKDGRTGAEEKRFLLEAQAAAQLKSDYIARVTDFGVLDDGRHFMALEYLEGKDLGAYREEHGHLAPADACDLVIQACAGLAQAHALGVVHRDVKPSNLFVTHASDGSTLVKVLDFGVSKFAQGAWAPPTGGEPAPPALTSTGLAIGTPLYMSPEQVKARRVDERSDIWGLGVVLFELLTGRTPFYDDSLGLTLLNILERPHASVRTLMNGIAAELEQLVDACLSKEPEGRPASVVDLAERLAPFASEEGRRLALRVRAIRERAEKREHISLTPAARALSDVPTQRVHALGSRSDAAAGALAPASTPSPTGSNAAVSSRGLRYGLGAVALLALVGLIVWAASRDVESDEAREPTAVATATAATSGAPTVAPARATDADATEPPERATLASASASAPSPTSAATIRTRPPASTVAPPTTAATQTATTATAAAVPTQRTLH